MLKSFLIAMLLFLASCANNQPKNEVIETGPHETATNQAQLQLNNGHKWKLDASTRQNMNDIKAYISQASVANREPSGAVLQKYSDKLIKECRMTWPDHKALHTWLTSFLQHVQAMKNNQDAEAASHALNEDVKTFDTYFE